MKIDFSFSGIEKLWCRCILFEKLDANEISVLNSTGIFHFIHFRATIARLHIKPYDLPMINYAAVIRAHYFAWSLSVHFKWMLYHWTNLSQTLCSFALPLSSFMSHKVHFINIVLWIIYSSGLVQVAESLCSITEIMMRRNKLWDASERKRKKNHRFENLSNHFRLIEHSRSASLLQWNEQILARSFCGQIKRSNATFNAFSLAISHRRLNGK